MKAAKATVHCAEAYVRATTWNRKVKTFNQEIDEQTAKFTELQQQCKNFAIKSSSFIKMIASGGMKLKSGKLKGTIKSKVKAMADSMAEFKGDVKLGG
jgi:cell division protein FtsL